MQNQFSPAHRSTEPELELCAQQVFLACMLAKAPVVIPIPGSSRPETIRDSVAAAGLELSADELRRLDAA